MNSTTTTDILQKHTDRFYWSLLNAADPAAVVLETALDICAIKAFNTGEINGYIIAITLGGPSIYIDTAFSEIRGYWFPASVIVPLPRRISDAINDYLLCYA